MASDVLISYPQNERNPTGRALDFQLKFHKSPAKYRLNAGGFGTGKSSSLAIECIKQLMNYPGNYGLIGRKDLGELKSTTLKELLDLLPEKLIKNHNKQDKTIRLVNGSELYYMNLDDSREAVEKIKSLNLGFACIDQLEEIEESIFYALQGRLRRANSERCFFATANPDGHDWMWRRWKELPYSAYLAQKGIKQTLADAICATISNRLDAEYGKNPTVIYEETAKKYGFGPDEIKELFEKSQYELFEATTLENIYLPADYVAGLMSYPQRWINRYVFCSWEEWEGIVYNEFREALHTFTSFEPQNTHSHYIVLDYGYRNPTAIIYAAVDYDGILWIYDEYYETGKLISETSAEIKQNKFFNKATKLIDPSTKNVQRDGKSIQDEFADNGIHFQPADNDVLQGINRVNECFKLGKIMIGKNCTNLLREIGEYRWKAIRPGSIRNDYEEPVKRNDHLCDALRYTINYIGTPKMPEAAQPDWAKKLQNHRKSKVTSMAS